MYEEAADTEEGGVGLEFTDASQDKAGYLNNDVSELVLDSDSGGKEGKEDEDDSSVDSPNSTETVTQEYCTQPPFGDESTGSPTDNHRVSEIIQYHPESPQHEHRPNAQTPPVSLNRPVRKAGEAESTSSLDSQPHEDPCLESTPPSPHGKRTNHHASYDHTASGGRIAELPTRDNTVTPQKRKAVSSQASSSTRAMQEGTGGRGRAQAAAQHAMNPHTAAAAKQKNSPQFFRLSTWTPSDGEASMPKTGAQWLGMEWTEDAQAAKELLASMTPSDPAALKARAQAKAREFGFFKHECP